MENLNGALGFKATLDIDDFNVSAQAMERQIRNFSSSAISEIDGVEDAFSIFAQKAAEYISYYLVGQGMAGLLRSIVQVRGQFQQLEIAFETMLGSEDRANKLMAQMVDTAAKTPFDLMGVAEGAKQLMAYGLSADKVNDTLVRLGNIASGLSIPLNDIVYLYGTTMVQGRLYAQDVRQFTGRGIPLVKELADKYGVTADKINEMVSAGKIGFPDVEEVLNKMTNAGGQFYNLMEKQSASLTGQISNLEDAWDSALNKMGEDYEGLFSGVISTGAYLVEHFDTILRIIKSLVVAYGSYKTAMIVNSVAVKGYTGVAIIDNTVQKAKIALMKVDAVLSGEKAAQTKAMTQAEEAHVAALQAELTAEQNANIVKQLRIATIQSLLTVQQQEYLSNLNLTTSSAGYEAAALSVLTVEQQVAFKKVDLSTKSAVYRAALEQEVAAKRQNQAASVTAMRVAVKEAAQKVESAKTTAISANQAVEAARYEVYWAEQSGNATAIATAKKKLEVAVDTQAAARKAALAAQSDFFTKKKQLETTATLQSTTASRVDTAAKGAQATATTLLTTITGKATNALKMLWATMAANPIGAVLALLGAVISAIMLFNDSSDDASNASSKFGDSMQKQLSALDVQFAMLTAGTKGTNSYKKAIDEVNEALKQHNLALISENSTLEEIEDAHNRVEAAIKKENAENERSNSLNAVKEDYATALDEITKNIEKELSEAHHYVDLGVAGISVDSDDIQSKATALTAQIRGIIEDKLPEIAKLDTQKQEEAKQALRKQITDIMVAAGVDEKNASLITDYNWIDDWFYDVFTESGGIIDQAINARKAFDEQTQAANDMADAVVNASNSVLGLGDSTEKVIPKVDLSKYSLDELHEMAGKLDGAKCDIDIKVYGYEDAKAMLSDILGMISTKQNDLNTEAGINAEIQALKKLRGEAQLGSQQWKDYNTQIDTLQKKLATATGKGNKSGGSGSSHSNTANNLNTYNQKRLEADRKLEEARISIMEEGYEKRKAQLDLQHKQALQQIDKEEKELEQARKKAGKGELTQEQKDTFTERRILENKSYEKSQNNLFDGELDYKKKQYELYFRWVKNMGQDVADKQFSELLNSGSSYKDYVEKEIAKLEQKRNNGTLTEGEGNQLITLNMQYDEITGAKSAMDTFRESVQRTISQAQTLAEKIDAVAKARELLNSGGSGLIGDDEKAQASLFLSEQEQQNEKDLQDEVLTQYRTYEEQKASIMQHYQLLMTEAQKMGDEERVNLIKKAQTEALSTLNTSFLQQTDSWKQLFNDIDYLSVGQLEKLVKDIEGQLPNLKLSPVDYKAVVDSLNKAKEEIIDKNPFKALATFYDDYIAAKKKLADAKAKMAEGTGSQSEVDAAEADVKKAATNITKSITKVTDIATSTASSLQSMFDALGMDDVAEGIGTAIELMGQLGNAAGAVGQIMSGDIVGGVTGLISAATSLVSIFAGLHDSKYQKKIEKLQDQIDALERSYNRLERAFNNTYWVFTDEQREAYDKNIALINQQIAALEQQRKVAAASWNFAKYAELTAQIKDLNNQLSKAKEGDDMLGLYEQQKQALLKQQELIQQQIDAEKSKKKTDDDKIQSWQDDIDDITEQLEDLEQQMMETFAGTDVSTAIDDFADAIVDAFCAGEDAAEALAETTKSVLKNAVVQALKRQFLAKAINDAVEYLASAMEDGTLTDQEKENFEYMVNTAGETFKTALEGVGDWIKDLDDEDTDSLTGAVTSMSEETGGVIAGRLNAFIINQNEQTGVMREQLLYQAQIAQNTANSVEELKEIRATLKRIETKDSSLLSQGIS